jgi:PPOX class probable F420-dependent enzyme
MATLSDPLVQQLLHGRHIATLATHNPDGSAHMVAVWFYFDGASIQVATAASTRKARNLRVNRNVSLMVDSRDPAASYGASIAGTAELLTGETARQVNDRVHRKYLSPAAMSDPKVGPIFAGWDDLTIQITPRSIFAWDMREADRQVFGGSFQANPSYLLSIAR